MANTSFLSALNEYILPGNTATIIAQNSVVLDSQIVTDLINGINLNSPGITPPPAPGSLDTGFNVTGEVITPMGAGNDIANAVAVQTDGKIVAAGYSGDLVGSVFALARYNADGSLDTTFGTNGKLTTAIGSSNFSSATGVAIQADGKIIASGAWGDGGLIGALALARYNTDGSLDTTFGTDGKYAATEASGVIQAIAIQADKQILVAGGAGLARYNTDGSIDATFGTGGKVSTTVGLGYVATTVALQTDKKIITAGHYVLSNGTSHAFALVRYNTDGSLDTSFDTDGIVTTAVGTAFDIAYAIAIQGDGKIVATGTSLSGTGAYELALLRYNTDGSLDSTFGTDGKVVTGNGATADSGNGVAIQTDGKIVVTASYIVSNAGTGMAVVRYNADGSLDTAFGSNGRVSAGDGASRGIVIQGDKKIIAAGNLKNGIYYNFALARFLP